MAQNIIENGLDKTGLAHLVTKIREYVSDSLTLPEENIARLKKQLDTLIGSDDVTSVIDTFNEIENFLQGVTNTDTLTGLLEEMKSEIVALIPTPEKGVIHISKFVSGVTTENGTTTATSKSAGARIVFNNTNNRLLLCVGNIVGAEKYYKSWGDASSFGEIVPGGVMPSKDRVYTIDSGDTEAGVDIALWNGSSLSPLHFSEIEKLIDDIQHLDTEQRNSSLLISTLRTDLDTTHSMAESNGEEILELQTRVTALETSMPRAITIAEIDAMFE